MMKMKMPMKMKMTMKMTITTTMAMAMAMVMTMRSNLFAILRSHSSPPITSAVGKSLKLVCAV